MCDQTTLRGITVYVLRLTTGGRQLPVLDRKPPQPLRGLLFQCTPFINVKTLFSSFSFATCPIRST